MTLILRHKKGAPLTVEELDGNFEDLDGRIKRFEVQAEELESIAKVTEKDGKFVVTGSRGSALGEIPIPTPKLQFKKAWKAGTAYYANDLVTHKGALLVCKTPHVSEEFEAKHWIEAFKNSVPLEKEETTVSSLPLYEKTTLPKATLGTLAILISEKEPQLILGDGKAWMQLTLAELEI